MNEIVLCHSLIRLSWLCLAIPVPRLFPSGRRMNTSETLGASVRVSIRIERPDTPASEVVQESATPAIRAYAAWLPRSRLLQ